MAVTFEDAISALTEIMRRHIARGMTPPGSVVVVGGTALAAHAIRPQSDDMDMYAEGLVDDIVIEVEKALKGRFGAAFKIDATAGENLWGDILIRDIGSSPIVRNIHVGGVIIHVRALTVEDLFLLKLAAGRDKDTQDLPSLAHKIDLDRTIDRLGQFVKWHGNRAAIPAFADAFLTAVGAYKNADKATILERMDVPDYIREQLKAAHGLE